MKNLLLLIGCIILLSGCSYDTGQTLNSSSTKNSVLNLPPSLEVVVNNIEYPTRQGSYCWRNGNTSKCVDMASPFEMITEVDIIKVSLMRLFH
ncbi:hypothetical protein SAMN05877842_10242 [Ureibacillus acetophenoni]|uniref:Lipoprotein n=1 Tax=Ureibacillus acetophenoni TaxID=614649 RepID=A0A285U2T1_9BACL|nr:hypothetical protein SAMN05877842_10242 [Ureibacillus acetophenoni]